jgi:hypothetical protein
MRDHLNGMSESKIPESSAWLCLELLRFEALERERRHSLLDHDMGTLVNLTTGIC